MQRRITMVLIALLAGMAGACRDESPEATGPSPAADIQAVTAPTYTIKKLGSLGGPNSTASAINNQGLIVGSSRTSSGKTHAFLYQTGAMKDLGALAGGLSEANDINDAGAITGRTATVGGVRLVEPAADLALALATAGGFSDRALPAELVVIGEVGDPVALGVPVQPLVLV